MAINTNSNTDQQSPSKEAAKADGKGAFLRGGERRGEMRPREQVQRELNAALNANQTSKSQ